MDLQPQESESAVKPVDSVQDTPQSEVEVESFSPIYGSPIANPYARMRRDRRDMALWSGDPESSPRKKPRLDSADATIPRGRAARAEPKPVLRDSIVTSTPPSPSEKVARVESTSSYLSQSPSFKLKNAPIPRLDVPTTTTSTGQPGRPVTPEPEPEPVLRNSNVASSSPPEKVARIESTPYLSQSPSSVKNAAVPPVPAVENAVRSGNVSPRKDPVWLDRLMADSQQRDIPSEVLGRPHVQLGPFSLIPSSRPPHTARAIHGSF
ncbi:hypothetical protein FB45DRAFT_896557 [Roridomyces roridus]|uniref:Uncharacterized protein n=1 Tax=Roridomyces roridus TaxID=1738132 RepID=A0AAD7CAR4_9AGAR|nr:hypothetical protein FB45DRAFT_896557 [Roridomyces roridus]